MERHDNNKEKGLVACLKCVVMSPCLSRLSGLSPTATCANSSTLAVGLFPNKCVWTGRILHQVFFIHRLAHSSIHPSILPWCWLPTHQEAALYALKQGLSRFRHLRLGQRRIISAPFTRDTTTRELDGRRQLSTQHMHAVAAGDARTSGDCGGSLFSYPSFSALNSHESN